MRYLADTHLLIWAGFYPELLSKAAQRLMDSEKNEIFFSAVSIWESAIKFPLGKADFTTPAASFRRRLVAHGYQELQITSEHAIEVENLPMHHSDPFDRLLVAQAIVEGLILITGDKVLARYPGTLRI